MNKNESFQVIGASIAYKLGTSLKIPIYLTLAKFGMEIFLCYQWFIP